MFHISYEILRDFDVTAFEKGQLCCLGETKVLRTIGLLND